jgi:UDP:flavonoid glycosyltransferase YjiC (YdhE family)
MRFLFAFVGGNGHFQPLVPIARAVQAAGHIVAFACSHSMANTVEALAFAAIPIGKPGNGKPERLPLRPVNMEREEHDLREKFARQAARSRAAGILETCAVWKPDLIICDEVDFGSMIAAERLGIPHVTVLVIAAGSFVRAEIVADALNEVRAEYDLPSDPNLRMLSRYLVLSPFPPGLRDPAFPLPSTAYAIQPELDPSNITDDAMLSAKHLVNTPTVYFTLGTVFNNESGDLFTRVLNGLRDLPISLIVTVGRHIDPSELGPQPANVHVAQYIPQSAILPQCDAVVSHGGSGSVMGALIYGLPMVLIPLGADQPWNAARCEAIGVARVLDAVTVTPDTIAEAVTLVLREPSYRETAQHFQAAIMEMPLAATAVPLLEQLAREKQPLFPS